MDRFQIFHRLSKCEVVEGDDELSQVVGSERGEVLRMVNAKFKLRICFEGNKQEKRI